MIEVIQAGQFGKTKSLIEMHKIRKLIFKDRMGWDVTISDNDLEIDDFDLPETVYILARDESGRIAGVWRMLPSTSPSMIRKIWPEFLETLSMPISNNVWELSRFGVHTYTDGSRDHLHNVNKITAELIIALLKVCTMAGINDVYTMYNRQIARSVGRIGFSAEETSKELTVCGKPSVVGRIRTDQALLSKIQKTTGIDVDISCEDLPPILNEMISQNNQKERIHA
jgi:N-acyl-L-homoserine lactone synthetase